MIFKLINPHFGEDFFCLNKNRKRQLMQLLKIVVGTELACAHEVRKTIHHRV